MRPGRDSRPGVPLACRSLAASLNPLATTSPRPKEGITEAVTLCLKKGRGSKGHILNLGHGVMVGTPEESVKHFFDMNRSLTYAQLDKM